MRTAATQRTSNAVPGGEDFWERNSASDGAEVGGFQEIHWSSRLPPRAGNYSAEEGAAGKRACAGVNAAVRAAAKPGPR